MSVFPLLLLSLFPLSAAPSPVAQVDQEIDDPEDLLAVESELSNQVRIRATYYD